MLNLYPSNRRKATVIVNFIASLNQRHAAVFQQSINIPLIYSAL
jgi:hypothetical protein